MIVSETSLKRTLLTGCFLFISILFVTAQDSLYIYKNGQILYRSQANQIDSVTFHLPEYWNWKESDAIYQNIRSNPELSIFADMLEQSGYKDKLNDKTIWAPINASFSGVDLSDGDLVKKLVENHLYYYSSELNSNSYFPYKNQMLSKKYVTITKEDSQFRFDGNLVIQPNIHISTSVIHVVNGYAPYRDNLWKYLYSVGSVDSMRTFLFSYNKKTYDPILKDTVVTNELLTNLRASLNLEGSNYSVLIPNNQVWNATFDSLINIYPPTNNEKLRSLQRLNTKLYMIKHLFVHGVILDHLQDSIYTTQYRIIRNPTERFGTINLLATLSNGGCYSINKLDIPMTPLKGVIIEAEDSTCRSSVNSLISRRTLTGNSTIQLSNNAYSHSLPLTTSNLMKVYTTYNIKNLHPGKYNIYALFVPAIVEDTTLLLPYKVNFYLTFPDTAGVMVTDKLIASNVITNPKLMTKVLVLQNFDYHLLDSQIIDVNNQNLKLKIENAAKASESNTLSREIRTDCILFEPVEN